MLVVLAPSITKGGAKKKEKGEQTEGRTPPKAEKAGLELSRNETQAQS